MSGDSPQDPKSGPEVETDYSRQLGVVEAFVAITQPCPSGSVRAAAERALEAIKTREPGVLDQQAYFVLTAMRGWRGDRASQVRKSLAAYLDRDAG
jgi:hypothetical protein